MKDYIVPVIIDGLDIVNNPETVFGLNAPIDGSPAWSAQGATADHCALAAESGMRAFRTWKSTTPSERMRLFQKLGEVFLFSLHFLLATAAIYHTHTISRLYLKTRLLSKK